MLFIEIKPTFKKIIKVLIISLVVNTFFTTWLQGYGFSIVNPILLLSLPSLFILGLFNYWQQILLLLFWLYLFFSLKVPKSISYLSIVLIMCVTLITYFGWPISKCDFQNETVIDVDLISTSRQNCLRKEAIDKTNASLCTKLRGYEKNACLTLVGQEEKDYHPCDKVDSKAVRPLWSKWECISAVAVARNERYKCLEAPEKSLIDSCLGNFDSRYQWK